MFAIAIIVMFAGCAILFVDVIATKNTDFCQDKVPAEYIASKNADGSEGADRFHFFTLAAPEFRYFYEGKHYQGRSANVFYKFLVKPGQHLVPFSDGNTYYIYVNPVKPTMYVTDGEQRFAFMHLLGTGVSVLGIVLILLAMGVI